FVGYKLFHIREKTIIFGSVMNQLKQQKNELGTWTTNEKKAAFIFFLAIFLWFTEKWHMSMFGFEISVYMTAIIAATLILLPKYGILEWKEADIIWYLIL